MASTTNITTTYAGEKAGGYISAALLSGKTLADETITVKPNVKYKEVVRRIDGSSIVKDATCDFDPSTTLTIAERILEPKELQVNAVECKKSFVNTWEALDMGMSAHNEVPKSVADYIIGHYAGLVAQKTEQDIWTGTATNGSFPGFTTLLSTDAALPAANEVSGTTVDASNVITEIAKVVDAMPSALYGKEDTFLYVSQNIWKRYTRALGGFGASGLGSNGYMGMGNNQSFATLLFDGVPIVLTHGLGANQMILAQKSNLFFGTGLLADHNEVKIIDMKDIDGSQNFRMIMRYTAAVQYGVVQDIVTYGVTNSAN